MKGRVEFRGPSVLRNTRLPQVASRIPCRGLHDAGRVSLVGWPPAPSGPTAARLPVNRWHFIRIREITLPFLPLTSLLGFLAFTSSVFLFEDLIARSAWGSRLEISRRTRPQKIAQPFGQPLQGACRRCCRGPGGRTRILHRHARRVKFLKSRTRPGATSSHVEDATCGWPGITRSPST